MLFSTFPNKNVSTATPLPLDRESFIHLLSKHSLREDKDGKMFAPATFRGKRGNGTFLAACGLCLDFDHGQPGVDAVLDLFPGTLACFYSTHSHTPDLPRFRVVIPLSRPVDAEEHAKLIMGVKEIIPLGLRGCLDPSCFDRARAHYLPSCPPHQKRHAFIGHQDGEPLDVARFIALGEPSVVSSTGKTVESRLPPMQAPATPAPRSFEFVDPATGEVHDLTVWAAQNPEFGIVAAVPPQYRRGSLKDGRQHVVCPFEGEHTDQGDDLATFVANASPPQFTAWDVHCCHSHCADRDRLEYLLAMLERGWIKADQLQAGVPAQREGMKRPPYMNYRAQEFLAELVKQPLDPEEFRIHLHLGHVAVAVYDGTLPDDSWAIARILGLPEEQWLERFRPLLLRSGWLVAEGGRIFNPITRREYRAAQEALKRKIEGGTAGGLTAQAKRRDREASLKDT